MQPNRKNQLAGAVLAVLLLWPAAGSLPLARWNVQTWQRLNTERRAAPQTGLDGYLQSIGADLPPSGRVGLVLLGSPRPEDAARAHYLLQYALAPRQIVLDEDVGYVIAHGPAGENTTLADESAFTVVRVLDNDLRLFRRIAP